MNGTERYIRQATRGLSGQARRDAQRELHGAIEDKIWRFTLLGLEPGEATRAALRDLGSPHAIASGLTRVHTLPKAALGAVLAGVACLLGVQALAAVPVVRAAHDPAYKLCVYDEAHLKLEPPAMQTQLRVQLAGPGGRARMEARCRANSSAIPNDLLRLSDIIAAFKAGGVGARTLPELDGFFYLKFPGMGERSFNLSGVSQRIAGQVYVPTWGLINFLRVVPDVSVRLTGTLNPTLEMGPAKLQLGTAPTPVLASDLYSGAVFEMVSSLLSSVPGSKVKLATASTASVPGQNMIEARAPENSVLIVVSNDYLVLPGTQDRHYRFSVQNVKDGLIVSPFASKIKGSAVATPKELVDVTKNIRPAILVYRLDTSDLRTLKLTPVPTPQLNGRPPR
ncbi:hypothetical protein [Deinococcus sp.]|uniref:hypothetical protein n=1 Tax=Deinococcus sp. TaxID=47478 RepID=UPI003C7B26ED